MVNLGEKMVRKAFLWLIFTGLCLSSYNAYSSDFNFLARETITLKARGLDVVDVLQSLSERGDFNLSISSAVSGSVTLFVREVSIEEAFDIVLRSADLAFERDDEMTYVMTQEEYYQRTGKKFTEENHMKVFRLNNAHATVVKDVLSEVASSDAKVVSDALTNTVVLFEKSRKLNNLSKMVKKLDAVPSENDVDLGRLPLNKEEYYASLLDKLHASIPVWYFKDNSTKVKVRFSLSQYGELVGEPEIMTFSVGDYWKNLARDVVRVSAPFAPFPPDMPQQEESFDVELAL